MSLMCCYCSALTGIGWDEKGFQDEKTTYTTTQYNNWDKILNATCIYVSTLLLLIVSPQKSQLDFIHEHHRLYYRVSTINFNLFKQIKADVHMWMAIRVWLYACDCNYKVLTIMAAQVNQIVVIAYKGCSCSLVFYILTLIYK